MLQRLVDYHTDPLIISDHGTCSIHNTCSFELNLSPNTFYHFLDTTNYIKLTSEGYPCPIQCGKVFKTATGTKRHLQKNVCRRKHDDCKCMNRESPFLKVDKALIHLVSCLIASENTGDDVVDTPEGVEVNIDIRIHPPSVILEQDLLPVAPAPNLTYEEAVVRACQDGTMTQKDQKQAIYIVDTLNLHPTSVNAENGENEYLLASEKTIQSLKKREAFKDIINVVPRESSTSGDV